MADMTLEEALEAATVDEELVTPVNEVLVINPETRIINVPDSEKLFGARQDMDVERKYFKCPRIVGDNIDLSEHRIFVNYVPSKQDGSYEPKEDVQSYWCKDLAVEGDYITFSWKLSENAMRSAGYIAFAVYAKAIDENGNLRTKWHTTIAIGNVLDTLPDGEEWTTVYPDIVMQLLERMDEVEKNGGNGTSDAVQYIEQTLTEEQQIQARTNIGAASKNEVSKLSEEIANLKENGTGIGGVPNSIINQKDGGIIKIWAGSKAEYNALLVKEEDTIYLIDGETTGDGGGTTVTTYTITNSLTNVINSNTTSKIEENTSYVANLTPADGYTLDSISVTMGGTDVTSAVYSDGAINISSVTGNIVIIATAILSESSTGNYNAENTVYTFGVTVNGRYDESGNLNTNSKCMLADEFIKCKDATLLLKGSELAECGESYCALYDENKNFIQTQKNTGNILIDTSLSTYIKPFWYNGYADSILLMQKLNIQKFTEFGSLNETGEVVDETNTSATDFIELNSNGYIGGLYTLALSSRLKIAFYDETKSFISRFFTSPSIGSVCFEVPSNAKYYRMSITNTNGDIYYVAI